MVSSVEMVVLLAFVAACMQAFCFLMAPGTLLCSLFLFSPLLRMTTNTLSTFGFPHFMPASAAVERKINLLRYL